MGSPPIEDVSQPDQQLRTSQNLHLALQRESKRTSISSRPQRTSEPLSPLRWVPIALLDDAHYLPADRQAMSQLTECVHLVPRVLTVNAFERVARLSLFGGSQ